jgi:biopolymer transport protein ExbD
MKKLLTLMFALAVAFSLTMPVFAQDTMTTPPAKTTKKEKAKKAPKAMKAKKEKKEKKEAPAQ